MGVKTRFFIVLFGAVSLVAAVWFGRTSGDVDVNGPSASGTSGPAVSENGPYPKAVVDEIEYDFGAMEIHTTKRHTFVIRNEGKAPLILEKGETTCKCTLSELAKNEIPPGESVEVELEWTPEEKSSNFTQQATIHTNDPENREINLVIRGSVDDLLILSPGGKWHIGVVAEDEPTVVNGMVHTSILDDFKILSIESENPLLTTTFKKLTEGVLAGLGAKSGYSIEATLAPGIDVGSIEEILIIRTDAGREDASPDVELQLLIRGSRPGPFQILCTSGGKWNSDRIYLELGQFSATEGKQANLLMFVSSLKEAKFKILDIEVPHPFLKFAMVEDTEFESNQKQRFSIQVTVPPGKPPVVQTRKNAVRIKLKTNHPKAPVIEFKVGFIST